MSEFLTDEQTCSMFIEKLRSQKNTVLFIFFVKKSIKTCLYKMSCMNKKVKQ